MRSFVLALLATLLTPLAAAQNAPELYSDVRLALPSDGRLAERLAAAGVGLDHAAVEEGPGGRMLRTVVSATELARIRAAGIAVDVLTENLAAEVAARPPFTPADRASALRSGGIEGNVFGSMGGYPTFAEALAIVDSMRARFPSLVSPRVSIGTSGEGRPVWMFELGDNPGVDEGEAEVLFTALHHAREPQGLATALYSLWHLLENHATDPEATYLLDNRRLFVVPVLNPDGYVYNQTTNPAGGGFWRKNRRPNGGGSFGVDLNRNYGYEWGRDDSGSSPSSGSDIYRGPAPFSEPETRSLRAFLEGGRRVRVALNYHSHSNLWLYAWGYTPVPSPDSTTFARMGEAMTAVNQYTYGPGNTTIYPTNGGSDDWMYGERATKPPIFAFTPEVGSSSDGFWPPPSRILPLAQENLRANLTALWVAGGAPEIAGASAQEQLDPPRPPNGHLDPGERGYAVASVENAGQAPLAFRARLVSTAPYFTAEPAPFLGPFTIAPGDTAAVWPLPFSVGPDAPLGLATGLAVELDLGGVVVTRPLPPVRIGTAAVAFADPAASLANWTSNGWGLSSTASSPPTAFADSPTGPYPPGADLALTLRAPLDLSSARSAVLRFRARWDVEARYDFAQVLASTDGATWTPLAGTRTRVGSGRGSQPVGEPGYNGTQATWVTEEVDLRAFAGRPAVRLRFRLRSDGGAQYDGWLVDDVAVETFTDGGPVADEPGAASPPALALDAPAPNPARGEVRLAFLLPAPGGATLDVFDVLGRRVRTLLSERLAAGRHAVVWDGLGAAGARIPAGAYVVRLTSGGRSVVRRVTVVR